ncbi:relaxase/mobilization nuclease domain-containing protein [Cryobacterium sp. M91]|uniref:relaxase/mobilization nuclease domain-containing protein n=1 Tax=Cryobacterium sp. M91 TaxID=2048294 RepID=UPI000CE35DA1|nr:relaxase/mobilization nuclease domain-containing protein [Cryobacterium sp. M91]
MPVVVASASRSGHALISYALDDKPDQKGERYVMASGVGGLLVSVAKQQMRDVRKKWGKDKPGAFVQAYHVIQSFAKDELDPDDPDSWMTAQKLGRAMAVDRFPGRQVLIVTQRDGKTGCVHNHIVVNSVDTKTGRSLDSSIVMHSRLVEAHERVLEAEGFEQRADLKKAFSDATERRERGEPSGLRRVDSSQRSELREFQRYIMWEADSDIADEFGAAHKAEPFSSTVLKSRIELALADPAAIDWASFVDAGRAHGIHIEQRGKKGRGISYGMLREQPDCTRAEPSASDRRRCATFGTGFEMDAVDQALARNSEAQQAVAIPAAPVAVQMTLPKPQDRPAQKGLTMEERLRAALARVQKEEDVNTQRRVAEYKTTKASGAEARVIEEAPTQPDQRAATQIPGAVSLSRLREARAAHEAAHIALNATIEPEAAEVVSTPQEVQADAQKLRTINERNRRLGLPAVSPEQHAANQAMAPEIRKRRLEHPEWFDDTEPVMKPGEQEHVL